LRRKVSRTEKSEAQKQQEAAYEAEVQRALAEYERQIDDILAAEGMANITVAQRNAFRQRLAAYAHENELTNLTAAYKALKYEEGQKKRQVAAKTKERAAQKRNVSAVGRSGAGAAGAAPVVDSTDLSAVIRQAMDEASAKVQR
jgi:N-methylhydantoinase A/oxoprolinase/acetone carboxylase beta subunit